MNTTLPNDTSPPPLTATNADILAATRFIVQKLLVPMITAVGLCGNVISVRVLTHRSMLSSTNCYLTALAIFDVLYLVFSFTLSLKHYDAIKSGMVYNYWYPFGRVLTDICSNVSVYLTVTFSVERLVAVSYPMKGRIICTPKRARLITCIVALLTFLCTSPEFFETRFVVSTANNRTVVRHEVSEMAESVSYRIGYYYFFVMTFTVLPLILLCSSNGILVKNVFAAMKIRKRMVYTAIRTATGRRQTEQNRITIMLIIVVIVFLICQFPYAILLLYGIYLDTNSIPLTPNGINRMRIAGNIVNLLVLINASINFILYSVMSTKFRKVCFRLCCMFGPYRREPITDITTAQWWLRDTDMPLRFRSGKRSHGNNNRSFSSMRSHQVNRKSIPLPENRHNTAPSERIIQSTSADFTQFSNDSSDVILIGDDMSTPVVFRKVNKTQDDNTNSSERVNLVRGDVDAEALDSTLATETCKLFQGNVLQIQMTVKHVANPTSGQASV